MSLFAKFVSKFHTAEADVSTEAKNILTHIEDEFKALEARVIALEGHTHTVDTSPVGAPVVSAPRAS